MSNIGHPFPAAPTACGSGKGIKRCPRNFISIPSQGKRNTTNIEANCNPGSRDTETAIVFPSACVANTSNSFTPIHSGIGEIFQERATPENVG